MRIYDGSICEKCEYFEHECGSDDYGCVEFCRSPKEEVVDNFYETDDAIKECEGFKY